MSERKPKPRADWPGLANRSAVGLYFLIALGLTAAGLRRLFEQGQGSGHILGPYSGEYVALLGLTIFLGLAELAALALWWSRSSRRLGVTLSKTVDRLSRLGWINGLAAALVWVAYVVVVVWYFDNQFENYILRIWLFWLAAGAGGLFLFALHQKMTFFWALMAAAVAFGAGIKALGYLPDVSSFPFSLSWSEASRYYYASLPYASRLYGFPIPLSPWHPTRYLLLGLPFLIPDTPILVHRLWQVILWLSLSLGTGVVLARRVRISHPGVVVLVGAWAALFLLQGPVYYHLLVSVILVLWGFDRDRVWKTLVFVVLASMWAGMSRVNWYPVPAFLAAALYFIEKPVCESGSGKRAWFQYLWPVVLWGGVGVLSAGAAQAFYVMISGHPDKSLFGSSFTSALLWYRLLPSPTYPKGVLPAILEVTGPLMVLVAVNWVRGRRDWHFLRLLGIGAMALVLFVGGLVVSTKIGGGSNIHNLDAFIVLVLVVGLYVSLGRFASEVNRPLNIWRPAWMAMIIIAVPLLWNMNIGQPFIQRNMEQAAYDLDKLSALVKQHASEGEVLFITQRQMEVFDLIPGLKVVPEYELITLTEMAMSNNQAYLQRFYTDLENKRFALIVTDVQHERIQDPAKDAFAEENNAWVQNVSPYILKYYQSELHFDQGIALFVPRP